MSDGVLLLPCDAARVLVKSLSPITRLSCASVTLFELNLKVFLSHSRGKNTQLP